jgi:UDP-GlcNAc:undecaprenyl-phosphate GlcNAc-1-phosphate transferase
VLIVLDLIGVALLLSLLLTPLIRDLCKRYRLVDQPDSGRNLHLQPVPRLGGISVVFAYAIALVFIIVAPYSSLDINLPKALVQGFSLAPAVLTIFLTGVLDDIYGLKPWQKLLGQLLASLLAYWAGFGIYGMGGYQFTEWLGVPVTVLWLVALTNALNLIDGMDGLAAGAGLFATLTMLVAALLHNNIELALVTAPLVGALVGFLRYNFNPASIFLGDSGSLTIGFLLGCFGALWSHKSATVLGMTAPFMAVAIPLLEVGTSIVRRFLGGQPIFSSDRGHIHHRLLDRGLTPKRAVLLLYAAFGAAAALSLLQDVAHNRLGGLIIVLFCGAAWMGVQHLGYSEFDAARRVILRGNFRGLIHLQLELQRFEQNLTQASDMNRAIEIVFQESRELGFSGVRFETADLVSEHRVPGVDIGSSWALRIPFPEGQVVYLYRPRDSQMHPVVLTLFSQCVDRQLSVRLQPAGPMGRGGETDEATDLEAMSKGV